jgi:hypothetical protein
MKLAGNYQLAAVSQQWDCLLVSSWPEKPLEPLFPQRERRGFGGLPGRLASRAYGFSGSPKFPCNMGRDLEYNANNVR